MSTVSDLSAAPASTAQVTGSHDVAHAARSGAIQVLTIAGQALMAVTHVLLGNLFGATVFGRYQTGLAIMEVLTRTGAGGADKGMLRYVAAHRARGEGDLVRSALGTGLRLALVIGGTLAFWLIASSGIVASRTHEPALAAALRVMAPAIVFTSCVYVLVHASLAAKVTHANFIVRGLGEPLLFMAAGLVAAAFGRSVMHLAVAHVLAAAATLTLALFVVGRVFGRGEIGRAVRSPWLRGFAPFSIPLGIAELMNAILQRADVVLLTTFVGPTATGVYAAAEFLSRTVGNARYVFDGVAAPVFSEALHLGQRDRLRSNLLLMSRWVATAAAPIAVTIMTLRHELLSMYGRTFQAGTLAICVLAVSHLVNATFGLSGYILIVSGRSRTLLANNVVVAIANVALGLLLIPRYGLLGAAIAALAGVVLLHTLVTIEVGLQHRVYPVGWSTLKPLGAAALMFGVETLIGGHIGRPAARIPLVIAGGLVSYLAMLVALGLAPEDKQLIGRMQTRLRSWRARGR
jgi:O-antigen/teichoic acid export membrane protein